MLARFGVQAVRPPSLPRQRHVRGLGRDLHVPGQGDQRPDEPAALVLSEEGREAIDGGVQGVEGVDGAVVAQEAGALDNRGDGLEPGVFDIPRDLKTVGSGRAWGCGWPGLVWRGGRIAYVRLGTAVRAHNVRTWSMREPCGMEREDSQMACWKEGSSTRMSAASSVPF